MNGRSEKRNRRSLFSAVVALLATIVGGNLHAQHIRTRPAPNIPRIATFRFQPGLIFRHQKRLDENLLRERIEARIQERALAIGLRSTPSPDVVLTYSLRVQLDKEVQRPGGKRVEYEATRYELEIRMLDASREPVWTAICTGSVRDLRQKYVEEPLLRAVTLALAKFPK